MSLKPLQSHLTSVSSLYAPYYGGGGGGGGGPVLTASTLNVSTIIGEGSVLNITASGGMFVNGAGIYLPAAGSEISFQTNDGAIAGAAQLTGVSSINGVAYSPAAAQAPISSITTTGGYIGQDQLANLNIPAPFSVTPNKWYLASLEITDLTFLPANPGANDCFNLTIQDATNQTNLGTFNMAQLSTSRGTVGDCGFSVCGPFESLSTNAYFTYKSNAGSASTFIVTGGTGWLLPLN